MVLKLTNGADTFICAAPVFVMLMFPATDSPDAPAANVVADTLAAVTAAVKVAAPVTWRVPRTATPLSTDSDPTTSSGAGLGG